MKRLLLCLFLMVLTIGTVSAGELWTHTLDGSVTAVASSSDGARYFAGSSTGNVTAYSSSGAFLWLYNDTFGIQRIVTDPGGDHLWVVDGNSSPVLRRLTGSSGTVEATWVINPSFFGAFKDLSIADTGAAVLTTELGIFAWDNAHTFMGGYNHSGPVRKYAWVGGSGWGYWYFNQSTAFHQAKVSTDGSWIAASKELLFGLNVLHVNASEATIDGYNASWVGTWAEHSGTTCIRYDYGWQDNHVSLSDEPYPYQIAVGDTSHIAGSFYDQVLNAHVTASASARSPGGYVIDTVHQKTTDMGTGTVVSATTSGSYTFLARGSYVEVYDAEATRVWYNSAASTVNGVQVAHTTGAWAAAGSTDGKLYVYTISDSSAWYRYYASDVGGGVYAVSATGHGEYFTAGRSDGTFKLYAVTGSAAGTNTTSYTQYAPHNVRIVCRDQNGNTLTGMTVTATGNTTTSPASWLYSILNLPTSYDPTTTMTGTTDSTGSVSFLMTEISNYELHFTDSARGIDETRILYPKQDEYSFTFTVGSAGTVGDNLTYTLTATIGDGSTDLGYTYTDTTGGTTYFLFYVNASDGHPVYSAFTAGVPPATGSVTVLHAGNESFIYGFRSYNARWTWTNITNTVQVPQFVDLGIPSIYYKWIAIAMLVLVGGIFSALSMRFAVVVIPSVAWWLEFGMGWLTLSTQGNVILGSLFFIGVLLYIRRSEDYV